MKKLGGDLAEFGKKNATQIIISSPIIFVRKIITFVSFNILKLTKVIIFRTNIMGTNIINANYNTIATTEMF